jgi:dCTP diphosphatase
MSNINNLDEMARRLREFAIERDWEQFHSPKNLAMALSVEASELLEHFQWLTEEQSYSLKAEDLEAVAEEIADVQIYLVRLADRLGVDILEAASQKILKNEEKYPADKVRGSSKKYTAYQSEEP